MFQTYHPLQPFKMISSDLADQRLLSAAELVKRWEKSHYPVSNVTLARWRRDGRGPSFIKVGAAGRIFYSLDSVVQFEQANNIGSIPTFNND